MRYIKMYLTLLKVNSSRLFIYRLNFVMAVFSTLMWASFSMLTIILLTSKIKSVFGWTREELLLLTAVLNIVIGIYRMLFDRNFARFSVVMFRGQLDGILLKPLDSQFQLSLWEFQFYNIFRVIFAIGLTIYFILIFNISVSLLNIVYASFTILIGVSILYSLTYTLLTLTIWFPRLSNLLGFSEIYTGLIRYPKEMFLGLGPATFFLIPLILIVSLPTKIILNKPLFSDVLILCGTAVGLFFLSRFFWKFALRHYSSASS